MVRTCRFIILIVFFTFNIFAQGEKDSVGNNSDYIGLFKYESMPVFNGNLSLFVQQHIDYHRLSLSDSIGGKVFVSFWVDTLGYTAEHKVVNGISDTLNQEALRVTKLIKFEKPALQNGKPVKVKYTILVEFRFPKANKTRN